MITYLDVCDNCAQHSVCKIMPDLIRIANMDHFKNMNCEVQVHCGMFKSGPSIGSCCSFVSSKREPEPVVNCKDQCDFYDYCLNPIYVNDITALQIEAVKWQLPVTLTAMCRCLVKKENTDAK